METVKGDRDKEKERETEDLKEKLSAAERSIHTLSSEIDEENDTMDGLQEEIDKLGKQLEDTRGHNEAGIEAMRKQLEESLEAKDLELAEQGRRYAEEILELKRVIEEMGAEMEAVKGDLRHTRTLLSEAEETVKGDRDKEKERETEDLKEKLSAAERSIHTLSSEIDEENDTMDGLQEEIDKLGKQLEDTRGHNEAGIEAMRKQLEESLEAKDLELAEQGRR